MINEILEGEELVEFLEYLDEVEFSTRMDAEYGNTGEP
jgi:hypothetical protein